MRLCTPLGSAKVTQHMGHGHERDRPSPQVYLLSIERSRIILATAVASEDPRWRLGLDECQQ